MVEAKGLLKKIYERYVKHPVRNTLLTGLLGLSALTIAKDNVHFIPAGTIEFNAPQKNQYVWGFVPFVKIKGESPDVKLRNYAFLAGVNTVGDKSSVKDMKAYGLFGGDNTVGNDSSVKDMKAYDLLGGLNTVGDNSSIGDMKAYGLLVGGNAIGNNSSVKNMKAYSLLVGLNIVGDKTKINGKVVSRGIVSKTPSGSSPITRIGEYKNYIHSVPGEETETKEKSE